jgi:hypothetical protein
MPELGVAISSKDHPPNELVRQAAVAEHGGFTHVYIHQIGDNQAEFAEFAAKELMPKL